VRLAREGGALIGHEPSSSAFSEDVPTHFWILT
jgi:hypothetical protein